MNLLELLYEAYRAELGIIVQTNDPERLRQKLYAERKKDPDLACLSFRISPTSPESELLIIKKAASHG
jgi:hypothetical protein